MSDDESKVEVKEETSKEESPVIAKIDFPRFDTDDIETWFICLEAAFSVNGIKRDKTKFNAVIVALENRAKYVYSVIKSCSDSTSTNKYDTLKAAVIAHFRPSESQQLTSLLSGLSLGDQKPSALLSEMRRLGGTGCTDSVLANLWLRALPSTVTAIIAAMPTNTSLDEQAKVADKILEAPRGESFSIKADQPSSSSALEQQVAELTRRFDEAFSGRSFRRGRSKSRSSEQRQRTPSRMNTQRRWICWFHYRYGVQARKCEKQKGDNPNVPCIFFDGKLPVFNRTE